MSTEWDSYFAKMVRLVSTKSQDPSSKFGAVIVDAKHSVLATGYNGIPRGIEYRADYFERPDKYMYFVHAEQNAILQCAARGVATEGSTMYVISPPCAECAKTIIQAGIRAVYWLDPVAFSGLGSSELNNWMMTMQAAEEMLRLSGVKLHRAYESEPRG